MVQDSGDPSLALGMTLWFCGHGGKKWRFGYIDPSILVLPSNRHFFPCLTLQTSVILSGSEGSPSIILIIHLN
jgi:hypothetical protein